MLRGTFDSAWGVLARNKMRSKSSSSLLLLPLLLGPQLICSAHFCCMYAAREWSHNIASQKESSIQCIETMGDSRNQLLESIIESTDIAGFINQVSEIILENPDITVVAGFRTSTYILWYPTWNLASVPITIFWRRPPRLVYCLKFALFHESAHMNEMSAQ